MGATNRIFQGFGDMLREAPEREMTKLRVNAFGLSLDGYGAGPDQDLANPMGVGGMALHQWVFGTKFFSAMMGQEGGAEGVDNAFAVAGFDNLGAWILGRNMFGPVRGPWPDDSWKGWWGDTPPYHTPVFVLTNHARADLAMDGGTVFHFVTGGIEEAWERARDAAGGKDVRLGGGTAAIRQYLQAGLLDSLHLAVAPVLMGRGEALFAGLDLPGLGYQVRETVAGEGAMHVILGRTDS
jgi:dihydrofolate reductase